MCVCVCVTVCVYIRYCIKYYELLLIIKIHYKN